MPERLTGEEEFAKLDPEIQLKILGPSRFELYESGQAGLRDFYEETKSPAWGPQITLRPVKDVPRSPSLLPQKSTQYLNPLSSKADDQTKDLFEGEISVSGKPGPKIALAKALGSNDPRDWAAAVGAPGGSNLDLKGSSELYFLTSHCVPSDESRSSIPSPANSSLI